MPTRMCSIFDIARDTITDVIRNHSAQLQPGTYVNGLGFNLRFQNLDIPLRYGVTFLAELTHFLIAEESPHSLSGHAIHFLFCGMLATFEFRRAARRQTRRCVYKHIHEATRSLPSSASSERGNRTVALLERALFTLV